MFENIGSFFKKIMKNEPKELLIDSTSSKDAAKERLHIVLMQDRANVSADFLELMKEEIVDVIKKYIVVDETQIDVRLTNQENEDGTMGAPSLHANIPILNIRNDIKCEVLKDSDKEESSAENDRTQIIQIVTDEDLEKNINNNENNGLVNNENNEKTTIEEINDMVEVIDESKNNNEIEEKNIEVETENSLNANRDYENNEIEEDVVNSVIKENEKVTLDIEEIDKQLEEVSEDDDDDDVTFDDLLKAAEEEERLQKLENVETENKIEEKPKKEVKKTQKPKRSVKGKTTKTKKNKK